MTLKLLAFSILLILLSLWQPQAKAAAEPFTKEFFDSRVDHGHAFFALRPPSVDGPDCILFAYMHALGANCTEPFILPPDKPIAATICDQYKSAVFLSCHTGDTAWNSDAAMSDITENITKVCENYPVTKIVLVGSSMGACTALTYAAVAPHQIKAKIVGVVAVEAAGDLQTLYTATSNIKVRETLSSSFGGTPKEVPALYRRKSFFRNLPTLNRATSIFIVSAKQDSTMPNQLQKDIVAALRNRDIPHRSVEVIAAHGIPPASIYLEGTKFILDPAH